MNASALWERFATFWIFPGDTTNIFADYTDHVQLSCTLDGARGNTVIESFISRFKDQNRSLLLDAPTIEALEQVVSVDTWEGSPKLGQ